MKIYLLLLFEYFKIGCLSVGGGYATIPFLYFLTEKYDWFSALELANMIAVSNITPGPIGLNMATYSGFTTAGILGSIIATTALVLPSLFFVITVAKLLKHPNISKKIDELFIGLRPTACALIGAICIKLFLSNVLSINSLSQISKISIDIKSIIAIVILFFIGIKTIKKPVIIITAGTLIGIIFKL